MFSDVVVFVRMICLMCLCVCLNVFVVVYVFRVFVCCFFVFSLGGEGRRVLVVFVCVFVVECVVLFVSACVPLCRVYVLGGRACVCVSLLSLCGVCC